MAIRYRFFFFYFNLFILSGVPVYAADRLDIVTLHNGDIYNGAVAETHFILDTDYGVVRIPYGMMAKLQWIEDTDTVRLSTQTGDIYTGELQQDELTVLRTLDTTLPIDVADIKEIKFNKKVYRNKHFAPDLVHTNSGDFFLARITSGELLLKQEQSIHLINRDDIHLIDCDSDDGEQFISARVILNSGQEVTGRLISRKISVESRFGDKLSLDYKDLQSVAISVSYINNDRPQRVFQQHSVSARRLQDRLRGEGLAPSMVILRGGQYERGDLSGDGDFDEQTVQKMSLKPFAIGIYEVTFEEYDRFARSNSVPLPDDEGWGRDKRPVVNVSWEQAIAYTDWLSRQTGKKYRLPTDAEWEYAARAGSRTRFWWGDELLAQRANCEGCGSLWDGNKTVSVGRFKANDFGLFDTAGNVFEWVEDCWQDQFGNTPEDGMAVAKPGCGKRVIRGGAWSFPVKEIRSSNRWRDFPSRSSDDTGFRVVRELQR